MIVLMEKVMEKVNAVKVGGDYGEGIKADDDGEDPKEKLKVEKKGGKEKEKEQKKGFGVDALKKLNRQFGCGFWGTIGCNRSTLTF